MDKKRKEEKYSISYNNIYIINFYDNFYGIICLKKINYRFYIKKNAKYFTVIWICSPVNKSSDDVEDFSIDSLCKFPDCLRSRDWSSSC
jgi:hypothetical protein